MNTKPHWVARAEVQPYVRAGTSPAGATDWSYFTDLGVIAGVQATIDTSTAGFGSTPSYVANLMGDRVLAAGSRVADGILTVVAPAPGSFVARVTMPRNLKIGTIDLNPNAIFTSTLLVSLRNTQQWCVAWIAMEG